MKLAEIFYLSYHAHIFIRFHIIRTIDSIHTDAETGILFPTASCSKLRFIHLAFRQSKIFTALIFIQLDITPTFFEIKILNAQIKVNTT